MAAAMMEPHFTLPDQPTKVPPKSTGRCTLVYLPQKPITSGSTLTKAKSPTIWLH